MDNETKAGCLNLLFNIPYVSWIFLLGPPALIVVSLMQLLGIYSGGLLILLLSVLLIYWLRFLEKRVGIRMTLPFIPIPWVLIAWAGVAFGIFAFIAELFLV